MTDLFFLDTVAPDRSFIENLLKGVAMKVLEAKPWLVFDCTGCKSKLEAEVSDVKCHAGRDISGCYDEDYYVKCPVCGTERSLSHKEVPPLARKKHS